MQHYFLNQGETPVSTWKEAFPGGREVSWEGFEGATPESGLLWLRLPHVGVEGLLKSVRQISSLPLAVMSDLPTEGQAAACLAVGASAYCNTHAAPVVLTQIAAVVSQGGLWLGQDLLQRLMGGVANLVGRQAPVPEKEESLDSLTDREKTVAQLVAAGASNREIAADLGITERTVKAHLGTIFSKLQVRDRLQLSLKVNGLWP